MKTNIADHEGLEVVALHYLDLDTQTGKGYRVKELCSVLTKKAYYEEFGYVS